MKKFVLSVAVLLLAASSVRADRLRQAAGPYTVLEENTAWAAMNNQWTFTPYKPFGLLKITLCNNNPTNGHAFNLNVSFANSPAEIVYNAVNGRWIAPFAPWGVASPVGASTCDNSFIRPIVGTRISIIITGTATAAGVPDTASLYITQADYATLWSFQGVGADAIANTRIGLAWEPLNATSSIPASALWFFNGVGWDRARNNSANNMILAVQSRALQVASPGEWTCTHYPAVNNQATCVKAAGGVGVRHIARTITACLSGTAASSIARIDLLNAAAVVWSGTLAIAANASDCVTIDELNVFGSPASTMTLQFTAAAGANTQETVTLTGYSTE